MSDLCATLPWRSRPDPGSDPQTMSLRFRRRVTLAPGLRLNLSKSGVSLSAGPRGTSVTVGRQGIYRNLGVPGTGLYHRTRIADLPGGKWAGGGVAGGAVGEAGITLSEQGWVELVDGAGSPLPDAEARRLRDALREPIQSWLADEVERINAGIDRILGIHLETPPPEPLGPYRTVAFAERRPAPPPAVAPNPIARLVPPWRRSIERRGEEERVRYRAAITGWEERRRVHEEVERERAEASEGTRAGEPAAMRSWIGQVLQAIDWPRETEVAFEIGAEGREFHLDVDLPPPERMPIQRAEPSRRPFKLNLSERSDRRVREVYMRHVHGVAFRLAGEVFRDLPTVERAVISGYTQRTDGATGRGVEEYLYSVRISRDAWADIDFERLDAVDPMEALARFELRREMSTTGIFRPVEPWPGPAGADA
jgi:hypothetical protein